MKPSPRRRKKPRPPYQGPLELHPDHARVERRRFKRRQAGQTDFLMGLRRE